MDRYIMYSSQAINIFIQNMQLKKILLKCFSSHFRVFTFPCNHTYMVARNTNLIT